MLFIIITLIIPFLTGTELVCSVYLLLTGTELILKKGSWDGIRMQLFLLPIGYGSVIAYKYGL